MVSTLITSQLLKHISVHLTYSQIFVDRLLNASPNSASAMEFSDLIALHTNWKSDIASHSKSLFETPTSDDPVRLADPATGGSSQQVLELLSFLMNRTEEKECSNCGAKITPEWRRSAEGSIECKVEHSRKLSMMTTVVQEMVKFAELHSMLMFSLTGK
ncbi:hypothetical protein KIN20_020660 [Parelaphostrongylus tenuis]|uniref:GATA-type domain-containing protein n=1 Tax=Parelaphostrongylus tenuis TaxID=148309 RepID=A0AAD5N6Y4_PARTN|nr:hypothetical protein KIN20_020660 [Parelaphostrongylus tenuis]